MSEDMRDMTVQQYLDATKPQGAEQDAAQRIKESDAATTYVAEVKQGKETIRKVKFANKKDANMFAKQHQKELKKIDKNFSVKAHSKKKGENLKGAITNGNLVQGEWLIR